MGDPPSGWRDFFRQGRFSLRMTWRLAPNRAAGPEETANAVRSSAPAQGISARIPWIAWAPDLPAPAHAAETVTSFVAITVSSPFSANVSREALPDQPRWRLPKDFRDGSGLDFPASARGPS